MFVCVLAFILAGQIHPNFEAQVLLCCGYGVRGEEVRPFSFPVHARGESAAVNVVYADGSLFTLE